MALFIQRPAWPRRLNPILSTLSPILTPRNNFRRRLEKFRG